MGKRRLFNDGWLFCKTDLNRTAEEVLKMGDEFFAPVDLPHDWLIYDTEKLYEDSCGWYRKKILRQEMASAENGVILRFDGVYMDSSVYVNGRKAIDWKYGYSTFEVDITALLLAGENEILVQVRYQAPNSRWYSGAGIYRNVWLVEHGKDYLPDDGTYVHTQKSGNDFILDVETEVAGNSEALTCMYTLCLHGEIVQELGSSTVHNGKAALKAAVLQPRLWSIESPVFYELCVVLYRNGIASDRDEIRIGFRTMEFTPDRGFFLNGNPLKVHGVCEHHDLGCLGAAFFKKAMERKLRILRKMGVNAIRTSHNMPAAELMELADEMGFLVMSEAFDMWERSKTQYDYARFFKEWSKRDVESWVRRDRNHPCLMLWSIGNEIYDTHADAHGQEIAQNLINYVRLHDPKQNAPVTIASNYMPWENAQKCADLVKIAGYNYSESYYEEHHRIHPDWVIYGSETASVVQSRSVYHFPAEQPILSEEDEQCSALGNSTTSWGAKSIEKCITDDRNAVYSPGQFLWTGFDYIGEPTPYHTKNSYFGQIDTAGFPKDSYYIFQAEWTDAAKNPMVHLFPYWDFNEGQLIDVRAATNGSAVELTVNGKSYGKQEIDHAHGSSLLGKWKVPYQKGEITAVAYDADGTEIAREIRHSFGDSAALILEAEQSVLKADGEDLCFVTIQAVDKDGYPVENAMDYVTVQTKGPCRLMGLDNGDSTDYDSYKGNCRKLFNGKLLAVIGSTTCPGEITVTVTGEGLQSAALKLTAIKAPVRAGISARESGCKQESSLSVKEKPVPVRTIRLCACNGQKITPMQRELKVKAEIFPANASDRELIWKAVNDAGIELHSAKVEEILTDSKAHYAKVTASGDGTFQVRCMSKSSTGKIKLISQLKFSAEGLGMPHLNPYELISAGLYSDTIGEIGSGNEKGIATARDGESGVIFSAVDFGEDGSDEITMPIFALTDDAYPIEIWEGRPKEAGSTCLATVMYCKPSVWNVYQEETWKLPKKLKGVTTLSFLLHGKVHIKGFYFKRL